MQRVLPIISLIFLLQLFILPDIKAQKPVSSDLEMVSCGSPTGKITWLKEYQRDPSVFQNVLAQRSSTTTYLPLSFHIVGTDDSLGMVGVDRVLASFCQLNEDFAATGIQFYIKPPIEYIYDGDLFSHDSVHIGGLKMLQYNTDSSINVYFVSDPGQGNCGYNLPYAGVAMNKNCLTGHTFAHELGHALALPHTFLGWEGGQSWNGPAQQSFLSPAPTQVTINYTDFKDTIYLDTLIIDTILVEYETRTGANANCDVAADGFCDTPADYLAYRWFCNQSNSLSSELQLDPDSVSFVSDGWYIMSYALDDCQIGFSQEQINAMLAYVTTEKPELLSNQNPFNDSINASGLSLLAPSPSAVIPENNPTFRWTSVPNATHYVIQIYREPIGGSQVVEEVIVSDTFYQSPINYPSRLAVFPYAWRVLPFNYGYSCTIYTPAQQFNTEATTNLNELGELAFDWEVFPNPTIAGHSLQIAIASSENTQAQISIYNAQGQRLWTENPSIAQGRDQLQVQIPANWPAGLYFVEMREANGMKAVKKLVLK